MSKEFSLKMNKSKVDILKNEDEEKEVNYSDLPPVQSKVVKIEIPPKTIITVLAVLIGLYVMYKLVNILIILFFAFVLASAALPLVTALKKKKFPNWLSISLVYLLFITIFFSLIALIVTPFITETNRFAKELNILSTSSLDSLDNLNLEIFGTYGINFKDSLTQYIDSLSDDFMGLILASGGAFSKTFDAVIGFGGIVIILVSIFIISVYIVADHDRVVNAILIRVNEEEKRDRIRKLIIDVEHKLGSWLVGQGTVSFIIGLITWIILTIFGVPFALPLAVLAALLEVVPNLGPVLVSIPIVLIALITQGPLIAFFVVLSYIILQQFQSYVLTPRIMGSVIGLHPLLVFVGMLIGFTLFGILGAVLAVPSMVLLKIGYEFYKDLQKLKAKGIL